MLRSIDVKYSAVKKNRVAAETDDNSASSNVCEPVWMPLWERFPVGTRTALEIQGITTVAHQSDAECGAARALTRIDLQETKWLKGLMQTGAIPGERIPRNRAERAGFEPADPRGGHRFSRPARSTAPAPLHKVLCYSVSCTWSITGTEAEGNHQG